MTDEQEAINRDVLTSELKKKLSQQDDLTANEYTNAELDAAATKLDNIEIDIKYLRESTSVPMQTVRSFEQSYELHSQRYAEISNQFIKKEVPREQTANETIILIKALGSLQHEINETKTAHNV